MIPIDYDINYQYGNGPRDISTRQQFAAVIRDITGIDTWYPVRYEHEIADIYGFKIAVKYLRGIKKYGYYWAIKWEDGSITGRRDENGIIIYSDYWTACVDLAKYIGCTQQEINDIFWNGKDRNEVDCPGCPCNRVEKGGKLCLT